HVGADALRIALAKADLEELSRRVPKTQPSRGLARGDLGVEATRRSPLDRARGAYPGRAGLHRHSPFRVHGAAVASGILTPRRRAWPLPPPRPPPGRKPPLPYRPWGCPVRFPSSSPRPPPGPRLP